MINLLKVIKILKENREKKQKTHTHKHMTQQAFVTDSLFVELRIWIGNSALMRVTWMLWLHSVTNTLQFALLALLCALLWTMCKHCAKHLDCPDLIWNSIDYRLYYGLCIINCLSHCTLMLNFCIHMVNKVNYKIQ